MVSIAVNWRLSTLTWVLTFALIAGDLVLNALLKRLLVALAVRRLNKTGWVAHRPLAIAHRIVAVATLLGGVAAEYFVLDSLTSNTACVADAGGVCDTSLRVATYYTNPTEWERPVEPSYRPMMRLLERSGCFDVDRDMPWRVPTDPDAVAMGERLYLTYCSQCHGSDARGARSFPNLADNDWLGPAEPDHVRNTILDGRQAVMPSMLAAVGNAEGGVAEVAHHVLSLSDSEHDPALAEAGASRFAVCAGCHGADGGGNPAVGAPNLTDDTWLYGGSLESVKMGRASCRERV